MLLKVFGSLFLLCFTLSSVVEAGVRSSQRQFVVAKKNAGKLAQRKKQPSPRGRTGAKRPARRSPAIGRVQPAPANPFSLLTTHTQENARLGELDFLFANNLLGQGQTVAVLEGQNQIMKPSTWDFLHHVIRNKKRGLHPEVRKNYQRNFLSPIGHPNSRAEDTYHGSLVASVILDLAPQAKVLPVNYSCGLPAYDTADALLELSHRNDVGVINISSHVYVDFWGGSASKYVDAIKRVAEAGKAIVIAAGNGKEIFDQGSYGSERKYILENLDSETRQSVIFAGSLDPTTDTVSNYSAKPGTMVAAQETFVFAPGTHKTSTGNITAQGTSLAAPYICAVLADLLAKPGVTPRTAVQAVKDTAERRPDGVRAVRAKRALERLEMAE